MAYHPLSPEQLRYIGQAYKGGRSSDSIARELEYSGPGIRKALERLGIERRDSSACQRRHACNHDFFKEIKNEVQAYWLGFIAADGSVQHHSLTIALAAKDKDHLVRFRDSINATHPVRDITVRGYACVTLRITSPQLVADLGRYGIVERKTYSLTWPTLPESLLRHFVRGYIDGDGGFYSRKSKHRARRGAPYHFDHRIDFSVTSNRGFAQSLQWYLMEHCRLKQTALDLKGNVAAVVRYGGATQVRRIFDHIYDDATVWLARKRDAVEDRFRQMPLPL